MTEVDDDFEFVLEPGTYWWVIHRAAWDRYRPILRQVWGKNSFTVRERTEAPGGEQLWIVLDVKRSMLVSATIMGAPSTWVPGDTAESLQVWAEPEDSWWEIDTEAFKDALIGWAMKVEEVSRDLATGGVAGLVSRRAGKVAKEIIEKPEEFLEEARSEVWKIALGVGAVAMTGLVLYKWAKS